VAQLAGLPAPVIQRANELLKQLESTAGKTLPDQAADTSQLRLFPENNPLIDAFRKVDLNSLSPIQALNLLYEARRTRRGWCYSLPPTSAVGCPVVIDSADNLLSSFHKMAN